VRRLLAAVLLLGACAASPRRAGPPPTAPAEPADAEQLYVELRNRDLELRDRRLKQGPPEEHCSSLRPLRDNICALADRICRIAEKEPPGSQAADFCSDAKERCARAIEHTRLPPCGPGVLQ
jgi:hypothetical protein